MIDRKRISNVRLARQIFKHNKTVHFRLWVTLLKRPVDITNLMPDYDLAVRTYPPYELYLRNVFIRTFSSERGVRETVQERVNTMSRRYGFPRFWLKPHWFI